MGGLESTTGLQPCSRQPGSAKGRGLVTHRGWGCRAFPRPRAPAACRSRALLHAPSGIRCQALGQGSLIVERDKKTVGVLLHKHLDIMPVPDYYWNGPETWSSIAKGSD